MADSISFTYGEFYDFPRMIRFQFQGKWYFLRSHFDEVRGDYAPAFTVYLLPHTSDSEMESDPNFWIELRGALRLGQIAVDQIGFDATRRKTIEAETFAKWLRTNGNVG